MMRTQDTLKIRAAAISAATALAARPVRVVKVYDEVRTAHLERIADVSSCTILYRQKRYDFDEELAQRIDLQRAGVLATLTWALRHPTDVIEIGEPLMAGVAPRSIAAAVGGRVGALLRGQRPPRIVTYAIENLAPIDLARELPWRARVRRALQWPLVPIVWCLTDRVAFGTDSALSLYRRSFRRRWPEHRLVPALPAPLIGANTADLRRADVLFLGHLSSRKGFPAVVAAWEKLRDDIAEARLVIVGQGAFLDDAQALAARDPRVLLHVAPPRQVVYEALSSCKVLVLPSQRAPRWREQVGLPIVEGLAHGLEVVTTTETGLAPWLSQHGHAVVDPGDAEALLAALRGALRSPRSPSDIVAALPAVDGRIDAEEWLFEGLRT